MPLHVFSLQSVMKGGLLLLALLTAPLAASAQKAPEANAEGVAAARALMDAAGVSKQFDTVIPALMQQMVGIIVGQHREHEQVIREAMQSVATRMSARKEELFVQIAGLYAKQFSTEDLKEATRFFASDVGKRFVAGQAAILPQSMLLGQRWGANIGREVDNEMRKELKKRGVPI